MLGRQRANGKPDVLVDRPGGMSSFTPANDSEAACPPPR